MKIFFPLQVFYPSQAGGPANSVYWLTKFLKRNGIDPVVVATNQGVGEELELNRWNESDAGRVMHVRTRIVYFPLRQTLVSLRCVLAADAVQVSSVFFPAAAVSALFARMLGKKLVVSPRDELAPYGLARSAAVLCHAGLLRRAIPAPAGRTPDPAIRLGGGVAFHGAGSGRPGFRHRGRLAGGALDRQGRAGAFLDLVAGRRRPRPPAGRGVGGVGRRMGWPVGDVAAFHHLRAVLRGPGTCGDAGQPGRGGGKPLRPVHGGAESWRRAGLGQRGLRHADRSGPRPGHPGHGCGSGVRGAFALRRDTGQWVEPDA